MGKVLFMLVTAAVITKSCTIGTGGGGGSDGSSGSPALAVPWVGQQNSMYCGPSSILMWALYDHVSGLTQTQIGNAIGTSLSSGSSPQQIANGVNTFTRTGKDAGLDYPAGDAEQVGTYYSQEVTSINSGVPFVTLIGGATHAGVASGGSWHLDDSTSLYVWDSVVFQDPIVGPNQPYIAGQWTSEDITHILSASASAEASVNYGNYGGRVGMRGSNGRIGPPQI